MSDHQEDNNPLKRRHEEDEDHHHNDSDTEPQHDQEPQEHSEPSEPSKPKNKKRKPKSDFSGPKTIEYLLSNSFLQIEQACENIQTILDEEPSEQAQSIETLKQYHAIDRLVEVLSTERHNPIIVEATRALRNIFLVSEDLFTDLAARLVQQLAGAVKLLQSSDGAMLMVYDHKEKMTTKQQIDTVLEFMTILVEHENFLKEFTKCEASMWNELLEEHRELVLKIMYGITRETHTTTLLLSCPPNQDTTCQLYTFGIFMNCGLAKNVDVNVLSQHVKEEAFTRLIVEMLENEHEFDTTGIFNQIKEDLPAESYNYLFNYLTRHDVTKSDAELIVKQLKSVEPIVGELIMLLHEKYQIDIKNYLQLILQQSSSIKQLAPSLLIHMGMHGYRKEMLSVYVSSLRMCHYNSECGDQLVDLVNGVFDVYADEKGMERELKNLMLPCLMTVKTNEIFKSRDADVMEVKENLDGYIEYIKKECK